MIPAQIFSDMQRMTVTQLLALQKAACDLIYARMTSVGELVWPVRDVVDATPKAAESVNPEWTGEPIYAETATYNNLRPAASSV